MNFYNLNKAMEEYNLFVANEVNVDFVAKSLQLVANIRTNDETSATTTDNSEGSLADYSSEHWWLYEPETPFYAVKTSTRYELLESTSDNTEISQYFNETSDQNNGDVVATSFSTQRTSTPLICDAMCNNYAYDDDDDYEDDELYCLISDDESTMDYSDNNISETSSDCADRYLDNSFAMQRCSTAIIDDLHCNAESYQQNYSGCDSQGYKSQTPSTTFESDCNGSACTNDSCRLAMNLEELQQLFIANKTTISSSSSSSALSLSWCSECGKNCAQPQFVNALTSTTREFMLLQQRHTDADVAIKLLAK